MSDRSDRSTGQQSRPATELPQISIIVPTRNEADNIHSLLDRISAATQDLQIEVLFVDDSSDDTIQAIDNLQDQYSFPVRLLARPPEQRNGLSGAVVDGLYLARGEWVCVMDADLQHPPETIPRMWAQAQRSAADMVVGSRRGDLTGPLGLSRMRSLTSKTLTILARVLFPRLLRNVSDPLTGLFLVKCSEVDIDVLRPDGFKILLEILVRCPDLHVTEVHFDFAPRHGGQSKADVREGMRFFRHVVRLRVTVNPHLVRFLIVISLGVVGNSMLLWLLNAKFGVAPLIASMLAVETLALWIVLLFEQWVFRERIQQNIKRSLWKSFLISQIAAVFVYLPIMFVLVMVLGVHYLAANIVGLVIIGILLYGLSEQWILTRDSMVWQPQSYFYSIHNILTLESHVQLAELQYFAVDELVDGIDIQIRLDRQGTPSALPGGISYDERLGRFGFGLTVLPGDFLQIVVSPLLGRSPGFLFTNIVEPILRWSLVPKGYALVNAASASIGSSAVLIHSKQDLGYPLSILASQYGYMFMADDLTIVDQGGNIYSYPKPLTVNQHMMRGSARHFSIREHMAQGGQRLLYTRFARRLGLWLGDKDLPAATLNTYLQWLVPQPKEMLDNVVSGIKYGESANCVLIVCACEKNAEQSEDLEAIMINELQLGKESAGFQPHPLLAERLRYWQGIDLMGKELEIIKQVVAKADLQWFAAEGSEWWLELANRVVSSELSPGLAVPTKGLQSDSTMPTDGNGESRLS